MEKFQGGWLSKSGWGTRLLTLLAWAGAMLLVPNSLGERPGRPFISPADCFSGSPCSVSARPADPLPCPGIEKLKKP